MTEETEERVFDVLVEVVVGVRLLDIKAESYEQAAEKAEDLAESLSYDMFRRTPLPPEVKHLEYMEETRYKLVDAQQDPEHKHSQWFDQRNRPVKG